MKRRIILTTLVMATLLVSVVGVSTLLGERGVSAANHTLEYSYKVSPGRGLINDACDQTNADTAFTECPDIATASADASGLLNDQSITVKGSGTLSVDAADGTPKIVTGGGFFIHKTGEDAVLGTWEAKQLLMFETYGPPGAEHLAEKPDRAAWRTGRALILVHLVDENGKEAAAVLEVGCRLPGNSGISGTIEGVRLVIGGGLNFDQVPDQRATLFVLNKGDDGF